MLIRVVKMSKKQQTPSNFLDFVPQRASDIAWHEEAEEGCSAGAREGAAAAGSADAAATIVDPPGPTAAADAADNSANPAAAATTVVVLDIENTGVFNKIAQKLFGKPRITHVHLDEFGSFVWGQIDGKRTVAQIAEAVHEQFGEAAEPLHPRIVKYLQIVKSYNFIDLKAPDRK
jgi:hypothetical protein